MGLIPVNDFPGLNKDDGGLYLQTHGLKAFIRSDRFIAHFSLEPAKVKWLIERPISKVNSKVWEHPRRIHVHGLRFWISKPLKIIVEIMNTKCGGLGVFARSTATGQQIWEQFIPTPKAAEWAEKKPAWPGAATEEINAFIADDPKNLVVCLFRQSRRSTCWTSEGLRVDTLPPYRCQLDMVRFDLLTGKTIWGNSYINVMVGILGVRDFKGIWTNGSLFGKINFVTGNNTIFHESDFKTGRPMIYGKSIALPWHGKGKVGINWFTKRGKLVDQVEWRQPRVEDVRMHSTDSGLAIQINHQFLGWLGQDHKPLWQVRAKPYIYRVYATPNSDVFIGTDGNGGRLFAFNKQTGEETLNMKPASWGLGDLEKVPGHDILVTPFATKRSTYAMRHLLVLSMKDKRYNMDNLCYQLLGVWKHGAILKDGNDPERLVLAEVRKMKFE